MEQDYIKGLIARDNTDWKIDFEDAVKDYGCGIMWKDQISDFWEIKESLQGLISRQGYFDYYNIACNFSDYHCKIVDFATKENYYEKAQKWEKRNPAWFSDSFEDYTNHKNQNAFIAFLVEEFQSIPEEKQIHIRNFITYNNKQASIKNAVAYIDILTAEQLNQLAMNTRIKEILISNKNLILTGAPGTGKTYLAKQIAAQMILGKELDEKTASDEDKDKMNEQYDFVQFHPSFDYTDFVEGLRPKENNGNISFCRKDGIFMNFCRKALDAYNKAENKDDAPKYVFVIDEINRGDLSKIFGELFFSIDPGYRGEKGKVKTQYSNLWTDEDKYGDSEFFYIPENVYIIGTMNDIDRSVESMDFAMRRRFAFKEINAEERMEMIKKNSKLSHFYQDIENRMKNLNLAILTIQGLSTAYQIGPAYFLKLKDYLTSDDKLDDNSWTSLWKNHLKGLLFEYLRGLPNAEEDLDKLERAYNLRPTDIYEMENGKVINVSSQNE